MKSLLLSSIMILVIGHLTMNGQSSEENLDAFRQANQAYLEGNYETAIATYMKLTDSGYSSKALFYNLGNAYMKKDDIAHAILFYEKALKLSPSDQDIKSNLEIAKEKVDTPVLEISDFLPIRIWKSIASALSPNLWLIIQILIGLFLLYGIYLWRISMESARRSRGLIIAVSSLFLFLVTYAAGRTCHTLDAISEVGIVMDTTSMMSGPENRSDEKELLHPGVKVKILDKLDDWYQVQLMNKDKGWVSQEVVEMI